VRFALKRSLAPLDAYGINALSHLLEALLWDISDVAKYLQVTPRTVRRWLDGTAQVPRSAVISLWFESHYGHAAIAAETVNACAAWRSLSLELEREKAALLERLSAVSAQTYGAANACVFSEVALPVASPSLRRPARTYRLPMARAMAARARTRALT
jgi:hypothetical protein